MQLEKNDCHIASYVAIAKKYQVDDDRYMDLSHTEGRFHSDCVNFAYTLYLMLSQAGDSELSKAYNAWREFYHGDSRRIYVLFDYADMLQFDDVSSVWEFQWDRADRNSDLVHEIKCRIFILKGITTLKQLYKSGALQ